LTSASGVLSAEARAGERASDAVVLKRQTPGVNICWTRRQQLRWPRQRQTRCASVAFTTDASGKKSARLGAYWTAFVERRTRGPSSNRHVCWLEIDRWKFDSAGHVAFIRATDAVCSVYCKRDRRVRLYSKGYVYIYVLAGSRATLLAL
jgi:hypothetical protein